MSSQAPAGTKLWGGRFTGQTDPLMVLYNESLPYDKILHTADVRGSIAYSNALAAVGILTASERDAIHRGLLAVDEEWKNGTFKIVPGVDEDIHTANERRLGELIGTGISGKLHTGRSRNDQVATDMRLWLVEELRKLEEGVRGLIGVMALRAEKEVEVLIPGYTHLQRAQPIRWSHWVMGHALTFASDLERLRQIIPRVNKLPLGSGALAGNPFGLDREAMAKELGFDGVVMNSLQGVMDRDFVLETLMWGSLAMGHVSRIAEDLIIYSTAEFGFVTCADAYSTGSSLMPQKKNPDSLELLRGKSGRVFGNMAGFMMTFKSLPSTYNKDLQESHESLYDSIIALSHSFAILTGVMSTLTIRPDRMLASLSHDMLATDLADYLVRKGVPFRETHHISGACVKRAEDKGCSLGELGIEELRGVDARFEADVQEVWSFERSVEARTAVGGTAKHRVLEQVELAKKLVGM